MAQRQGFDLAADGFGGLRCFRLVRIRQKNSEFLAAIAGDEGAGALHGFGEGIRNLPETLVSRLVAIDIVVALEPVDIDEEQREG